MSAAPPGVLRTTALLLASAWTRARARRARQNALARHRAGSPGIAWDWSALGPVIGSLLAVALNVLAVLLVTNAVKAGERIAAEQQGRMIVDAWFYQQVGMPEFVGDSATSVDYQRESRQLAQEYGGDPVRIAARLRHVVGEHAPSLLLSRDATGFGLPALPAGGGLPGMLGGAALLLWGAWLVTAASGGGDARRRRHPVWEFLLSHPVRPAAVFLAELLMPLVANPIYQAAPLVPCVLYFMLYGPAGLLAGFGVGILCAVAASCLGKAVEIALLLRAGARTRGALLGLSDGMAYVCGVLLLVGPFLIEKAVSLTADAMSPLASWSWPWLGLLLGQRADGAFSLARGALTVTALAALVIAGAILLAVWGAGRGPIGPTDRPAAARRRRFGGFAAMPMVRKECLWFARDRGALVQVFLLPAAMVALQLLNLRSVVRHPAEWNGICAVAILYGSYVIFVLGPKSLAAEGSALWLALTWPQGLERLLQAKSRIWAISASVVVAPILGYAAWAHPGDAWKIALLAVGWLLFAPSMAAKAVTLATVAAPSGEVSPIPRSRRWAAQLGMFTFAVGVATQTWSLAVIGIVFSAVTAAAMWQDFRARLPFLDDPWSERLPPPPTLMHAMIAISVLVDGVAVTRTAARAASPAHAAIAIAVSYALCAGVTALGVARFLHRRGVRQRDIWSWGSAPPGRLAFGLLAGVGLGVALGAVAHVYLMLLHQVPSVAEQLDRAAAQRHAVPHLTAALFLMGVLIAPLAEEFLFRGLLYRALDREWHGWRAVLGSAAFFAIYHPPLAWLPVSLVGVANALLFRRTGRLAPAVLLHMTYNAVVLA